MLLPFPLFCDHASSTWHVGSLLRHWLMPGPTTTRTRTVDSTPQNRRFTAFRNKGCFKGDYQFSHWCFFENGTPKNVYLQVTKVQFKIEPQRSDMTSCWWLACWPYLATQIHHTSGASSIGKPCSPVQTTRPDHGLEIRNPRATRDSKFKVRSDTNPAKKHHF